MKYKNNDLELNKLGLGCGGMITDDNKSESIATIHKALEFGINHLNTADFYGSGKSEMVIGEALKGQKRDKAFISVKFGALVAPNGSMYGLDVKLSADDIQRIERAIPKDKIAGASFPNREFRNGMAAL